jgi:superfamily I DNA/RNA helicase
MQAVARYCKSADSQIGAHHVPRVKGLTVAQNKALADEIAPHADTAWKDLVSLEGRLRYTHDHYFKIWAAAGPRLEADYVLFDEAQDANPALTGVIESQIHAQRVVVGDSAQQIYGWRGAEDALEKFDGAQLTLSQSFRFGPAVADCANRWLDLLDAPLRLTGFDKIPSRIGEIHRPDAILCRTNAGAMAQAMDHLASGHRVAVVGGGSEIRALADAAVALMAGAATSHPELMAFTSWDQVRDYAESEDDGADLLPVVKLIDKYGAEELIRATRGLTDETRADVTVSTAHKSKGREWSTVKISDDFREPHEDPKTKLKLVRPDEARLAYVAVTRAKEVLDESGLAWVTKVDGVTG